MSKDDFASMDKILQGLDSLQVVLSVKSVQHIIIGGLSYDTSRQIAVMEVYDGDHGPSIEEYDISDIISAKHLWAE